MIAASSLAFPGSRTLAVWRAQLAGFQPLALWVGHVFLHRLEALADVVRWESIEALQHMLLRAVALENRNAEQAPNEDGSAREAEWLARLDARLLLSPTVIRGLLRDLRQEGLLTASTLTESGRFALEKGGYPKHTWQRREFTFVERPRPNGETLLPPQYLSFAPGPGQRWQPAESSRLEFTWLREASQQTAAWKEQFAFPPEITGVADPTDSAQESGPAWQRVVLDRPERLLVAVIAVSEPAEKFQIFAAQQEGWELRTDKPVSTLLASARDQFPDLAQPPTWLKSWREWCGLRGLPANEVEQCTLVPTGERLDIQTPKALYDRLVAGKNDLLKGDTWLLAGDGYLRQAARVQVS